MGGALAHGSPAVETGASPRALFSDAALPTTGLPTDDAPIAGTSNRGATEVACLPTSFFEFYYNQETYNSGRLISSAKVSGIN